MAFSAKIVLTLSLLTIGSNARSTVKDAKQQPEEPQNDRNIDSYLPSYLQLPSESKPAPFAPTPAEPSTYLNLPLSETQTNFNGPQEPSESLIPPQYEQNQQVFYDVAVPSTVLKAPEEGAWNPDNDPIYFYELPASLTKIETPTNKFPKKYNKEVHSKAKPYSTRPKQEIELIPIEGKEWLAKKNSIDKKLNNMAKEANRRQLQDIKAQQTVQV